MSEGAKYKDVGDRLTLAMAEAGYKSAASLAREMNEQESRVRNWANGHGRPIVDEAIRLKRMLRITLDWLYDGDPGGLPQNLYIRLMARSTGQQPPDVPGVPQAPREKAKARVARRSGKAKVASAKIPA